MRHPNLPLFYSAGGEYSFVESLAILYIQLSTSICSVSQRERDIKVNIVVYMKSGLYEQQNLYDIDFLNLLIVIFSKFNSQKVL